MFTERDKNGNDVAFSLGGASKASTKLSSFSADTSGVRAIETLHPQWAS